VLVPHPLAFLREDVTDDQRWWPVRRHTLIRQNEVATDDVVGIAAASTTDDQTDARQSDGIRAHDARRDAGVQRAAGQDVGASPGRRRAQGLHFRVSRRIMASTDRFDAFGEEFVTIDNQRADGSVATLDGLLRELDAPTDVPLML